MAEALARLHVTERLRTVVLGPVAQDGDVWSCRVATDGDAEPGGMQVLRLRADDRTAVCQMRQDLAIALLTSRASLSVHDVDHPLIEQRMYAAAWPRRNP